MRISERFRKPTFVADSSADARAALTLQTFDEPAPLPLPPIGLQPHVVYRATMGRRFGRVAIDLGLLSQSQLTRLLNVQEKAGGRLGDLAIRAGLLTPEQVQQILDAQSLEIHVDARHSGTPPFLTWLGDLSRKGVVPKVHKVSAQDLEALRQAQSGRGAQDEADLMTLSLARRIFVDSAAMGASDMCVLVREKYAEVQLRLKGDYKVAKNFTMRREEGEALVRAIYTGLATVKQSTYNPRTFQDAQIHGDALPDTGLSSVRIIRGPMYPLEAGCSFMVARLQYGRDRSVMPAAARPIDVRVPSRPEGVFEVEGLTPLQLE